MHRVEEVPPGQRGGCRGGASAEGVREGGRRARHLADEPRLRQVAGLEARIELQGCRRCLHRRWLRSDKNPGLPPLARFFAGALNWRQLFSRQKKSSGQRWSRIRCSRTVYVTPPRSQRRASPLA
eukprot:scaffold119593_cov48-Phaeocystis_antarctica.AAC.1